MREYIDQQFIVLGDTLLAYTGKAKKLVIDNMVELEGVSRIGRGCFLGVGERLTDLTLGDSIHYLCGCALYGNSKLERLSIGAGTEFDSWAVMPGGGQSDYHLRQVVIRKVAFTKEEMKEFCAGAIGNDGTHYWFREVPAEKLPKKFFLGNHYANPVAVPSFAKFLIRFPRICEWENEDDFDFTKELRPDKEREVYLFDKKEPILKNEWDLVREMIDEECFEQLNKDEIKGMGDEEYIGDHNVFDNAECCIYSIDRSEEVCEGENILVDITMHVGTFFVPQVYRMSTGTDTYYLYRRLFLTDRKGSIFAPKDVALFDEEKNLCDKETTQKVFEKKKKSKF